MTSSNARRFNDATFLVALDRLVARLRADHPLVVVRRITPEENPSGDDWIWYFTTPASTVPVQVDPSTSAVFTISCAPLGGFIEVETVEEAAALVAQWLGLESDAE